MNFSIDAVDNNVDEAARSVTVTASASGYGSDDDTLNVVDDDEPVVGEGFYLTSVAGGEASADTREFMSTDTVSAVIFSDRVDLNDLRKATYKFEDINRLKIQGNLVPELDGTFTVSVPMARSTRVAMCGSGTRR